MVLGPRSPCPQKNTLITYIQIVYTLFANGLKRAIDGCFAVALVRDDESLVEGDHGGHTEK